jgi:hypothetical protein
VAFVLRIVAILIAVAGVIDPAWPVSRPPARKLVIVRATAEGATDFEQSVRARLSEWELDFRAPDARLPCAIDERCILIADGSVDVAIPDDLVNPPVLVTADVPGGANISIRSVIMSAAHQSAAGAARVELLREGTLSNRTEIRILDGGAVIGAAIHEWGNGDSASIEVPWWPIAAGARVLRVEAVPVDGERTTLDNYVDVGVTVAVDRSRVLVFDARPSWGSTFVRRALEDDARFSVAHRARLAPALSAGTADGRLDSASLDAATTLVVGGPDALTSTDVDLIERFVRVRGGTLILLPEHRPAGPWSRLAPGSWTEHLSAEPQNVGPLKSTEILRTDTPPVTATVVARSAASPSILVLPAGNGRTVVSGAMDAWRFRERDSGVFDRFWQSLVSEATAAGAALAIEFDTPLARPLTRQAFTVRHRAMDPEQALTATAVARCEDGRAETIRLWPAGSLGVFHGELPIGDATSCLIEAAVGAHQSTAYIAVGHGSSRGMIGTLETLQRDVVRHGGVVTQWDNLGAALPIDSASAVRATIHPLHSSWWILPFVVCLSTEWWLRRRHGLR